MAKLELPTEPHSTVKLSPQVEPARKKIGMQCVRVSAFWKFNDHAGKKATHALRTKDICVLSL